MKSDQFKTFSGDNFNEVVCGLVPYYNIDIENHAFFIICPKPYITPRHTFCKKERKATAVYRVCVSRQKQRYQRDNQKP